MTDLDKALSDLTHIRARLAAGTLFQGLGPAAVAATGGLAAATAVAQRAWPSLLAGSPEGYLATWISVAAAAAALIGAEMVARSRRRHAGLSTAMMLNAIGQFFPAVVAGAVLTAVLLTHAPETVWMLPGLWQMLVALGFFAALPSLPRAVRAVAAWYLVAGAADLMIASESRSLQPWLMGLPFGAGQLLLAVILYAADEAFDER